MFLPRYVQRGITVQFKYLITTQKSFIEYSPRNKYFKVAEMVSKVTFQGRKHDCASLHDFKGFFQLALSLLCLLPLAVGLDIVALMPLVLLRLLYAS